MLKSRCRFKKRKTLSFFTVMALFFSMILPTAENVKAITNDDLLVIPILATSDTHGKFYNYDYPTNSMDNTGSLSQIATYVKGEKAKNPNLIVIDGGDTIQDNFASIFFNDEIHPMIKGFNTIGYDVIGLGNHEFNYGVPTLQETYAKAKASVICANVYDAAGNRLFKPYTVVDRAGVKIAFVGLVTPNIVKWDAENLKNYKVTNPIEEAKALVKQIKDNQEADVIVGLLHMAEAEEYDVAGSGAVDVMNAVPDFAVVVAAHEHKLVNGAVYNGTKLVENTAKGTTVAKIELKFTKNSEGKYVLADKINDVTTSVNSMKTVTADTDFLTELKPFHDKATSEAIKKIGELKGGDLVPPSEVKGIPTNQIQDNALVDLINKVQMYYSGADVASTAAFSTDANAKAGDLRKCDVSLIYKYDNTLYLLEVTGKQLKKYMEWSAQYYNQYIPGDLTVSFNPNIRGYNYDMFSGIKYDIDISKPVGSRIVNLTKMDGTAIKDTDVLKLAVNNYRANSHLLCDGQVFSTAKGDTLPKVIEKDVKGEIGGVRELVADYIQNVKNGVITPEVDNNWKITGINWDTTLRGLAVKLINEGKLTVPTSADGRTPNVKSVTINDVKNFNSVVTLAAINDLHGSIITDGKKNLGLAKLAAALEAYKAENPNTVFLSAGDNYQGSALSNLLYGEPISKFYKQLGFVASAVGNHEFDWGTDKIATWAKDGNLDFLASNIYIKGTNNTVSWAKPYKIITVDGKKIGLIGIATPETAFKTKPDNVKDLEFRDPVVAGNYWANKLKNEGVADDSGNIVKVDAVIALTHLGTIQDSKTKEITGEGADFAKNVKNIDGVFTAHTHMAVSGYVNGIPVVQGYYNGRSAAKLNLVFDTNNKLVKVEPIYDELYSRFPSIKDDNLIAEMVKSYQDKVQPLLDEVVGYTNVDLAHDRFTIAGTSPLGYWTSKVMAETAGTQIGITNGGGLRTPIEKGPITMGKLYEVMPFDNTLVKMDITGEQLKKIIENGINNTSIGWVQVYGVKAYYDANNKITDLFLLDGTKVQDDKYYSVCTNDFMANGGDMYNFNGAKNVMDTNKPIRDALVDALKKTSQSSLLDFKFEQSLIAGKAPVESTIPVTTVQPATQTNTDSNLPKTGSMLDTDVLVLMGLISLVVGTIVARKRKIA